jgi:hypothetical protein
MSKPTVTKLLILVVPFLFFGFTAHARPEYLAIYAADPFARPELRSKCSVCHIDPAGAGERNAFGKAFAAAGLKITPELRAQFPDRFTSTGGAQAPPPVTFVTDSDSQAIVEVNGKRFLIDTKARTVSEMAVEAKSGEATAIPKQEPPEEKANIYHPVDVRLINLPTAIPIPKGSLWTDFTHRFPSDLDVASELFGLDGFAVPSFGFTYGVTDRIQVGAYRSPTFVGRPIELFAGLSLLDERKGHPFTAMARVGLEGRDNFSRNFTTSIELTAARSITRHAQIYVVPTVSINSRPLQAFANVTRNLPGETTFALGLGGALNIRPSVALMAEANYRINEEGRFGVTRPNFGFGIQKASISRRHSFSLVFSNGLGTTFAQRSTTRAAILPGAEESFKGLTIGFNLTRRLF